MSKPLSKPIYSDRPICVQILDGLSKSGGPSQTKVEVGVSLQGQFLCRLGKLSLVCLATSSAVYLFDVVALGDVVCFQV